MLPTPRPRPTYGRISTYRCDRTSSKSCAAILCNEAHRPPPTACVDVRRASV
ncbi:hypothetical protein BD311DRAFT_755841 [Dichomitus squalens]|uniref:Uncharacterized protein n=1 Tax=Dichomitus squalens TaxID=114155 RepID=A0A4V2K0R3_9APHY|nr:hypothetical protein BD311DRAFT_755841 [Dichomitus squalens]